jgi:hypothetical protein
MVNDLKFTTTGDYMNEEKWIKQYKEMQEFYEKRIKHLEESLESAMELNRKLMSMVVEVRENRD